jgi:hypothetical protein
LQQVIARQPAIFQRRDQPLPARRIPQADGAGRAGGGIGLTAVAARGGYAAQQPAAARAQRFGIFEGGAAGQAKAGCEQVIEAALEAAQEPR